MCLVSTAKKFEELFIILKKMKIDTDIYNDTLNIAFHVIVFRLKIIFFEQGLKSRYLFYDETSNPYIQIVSGPEII
jgi:hypothetical protein